MLRSICFAGAAALGLTVSAGALAKDRPVTPLYTFHNDTDGNDSAVVAVDMQGTLYGFTMGGGGGQGDSCTGHGGCGTIFKLSPAGEKTVLYSFYDGFKHDGARVSGMVVAGDGTIYGTTINGGPVNRGTVFKLAPDGTRTTLHWFTGAHMAAGLYPTGGVVFGKDGNLYGTTAEGGIAAACQGRGCGTVFRIAPAGTLTTIYAFKGGSDSCFPYAGLTTDQAGNLYGTTAGGCRGSRSGSVFKIAADGTKSLLHMFKGSHDGSQPQSPPVLDGAGNLYGGTTRGGNKACGGFGPGPGCGVLYKIAADGTYAILHTFKGSTTASGALRKRGDGASVVGPLFLDDAGNIYGTTSSGGASELCNAPFGCGTVFRLAAGGTETVLHRFAGPERGAIDADGAFPYHGLLPGRGADADSFYSTTALGGDGSGVVFKIKR